MQDLFAADRPGPRPDGPGAPAVEPALTAHDFPADRFRALFEHATQFMGVLAPDGTVLEANEAAIEFAGLPRDEVIGRPFWEVGHRNIPPATQAGIRQAIEQAASGACVRSVAEVEGANGEPIHIEFSMRPVRNDEGEVVFLLPEGRDVTDRTRAEQALRRSEERLAGILETAGDAIVSIDAAHRIVQFNRAAELAFGIPASRALGQPLEILMPARLAAAHRDHVSRFGSTETPRRMVGRRVTGLRANGEEFAAQALVSMLDSGGEKFYTAVIRDLTDERRRESEQETLAEAGRALSASLDFGETVHNIARLAVADLADYCVVDVRGSDGRLRRLAAAARDPANQELVDRLRRYPLPEDRRHIAMRAWRTRRTELLPTVSPEMLHELADDEHHFQLLDALEPGSVMAAPMIARDRALGVILLIARRGHRPYDRRDAALAEELGRRAALAIDNARLYRDAQESLRARQRILAIVAHDLRSPLSGITMAADMLRHYLKDDPNPAHRRPADAILHEADHMNRLIQDLLDVRAIDGGGLAVDPLPVAAATLLNDAHEQFEQVCAAEGIRLVLTPNAALPRVLADRVRVARVFANLVSNAIRFTPEGGRIVLGAHPAGDYVRFEVTDTGPGIPESEQERIFIPFWQGENADRTGAGLGLSIARGIVAAHGGHLGVASEPPFGSTFAFTLPRAD